MTRAYTIIVKGRVQGVGFRPFIFNLATKYNVFGEVKNTGLGVVIHAEGEHVEAFINAVQAKAPLLSRIDAFSFAETTAKGLRDFMITRSERTNEECAVTIPVDVGTCATCRQELNDQGNRRYNYPFINCTQCGPRYTIINKLPYDRKYTATDKFIMCADCKKEYENPLDRRYHAEPIACNICGPRLKLINLATNQHVSTNNCLDEVRKLLENGKIVAIKGIGGYHLCCDATNATAVTKLRLGKHRPRKPLALMIKSLAALTKIANYTDLEKAYLLLPEAPIVVMNKDNVAENAWLEIVAPKMRTIGVMLPYTPLYNVILDEEALPYIVATSANKSGQPILYDDLNIETELRGLSDYVLDHDRDILYPVDDSVVASHDKGMIMLRRSRGFVPDSLPLSFSAHGVVAFGSEIKSVFALGRQNEAIIGPHIGNLGNLQLEEHFIKQLKHLLKLTNIPFKMGVTDCHPEYTTKRIINEFPFERVINVQHHHAHMAACMEENKVNDDCFGIILDGTGFGNDGCIWGFEILYGNRKQVDRLAHLQYFPLIGGDKAIKEPWRIAACMLMAIDINIGYDQALLLFPAEKIKITMLRNILVSTNKNIVLAGSCGRLYDAVSAIIGLCSHSSYDSEAAVLVAECAEEQEQFYPFKWNDDVLEIKDTLLAIVIDRLNDKPSKYIAGKFQRTIIQAIVDKFSQFKPGKVVLSGGSFNNKYLLTNVVAKLEALGFKVYVHQQVPSGDGGLAYGQLVVAAQYLEV